ncbi:hypothetical protein DB346_11860 [Verrucomicrobia bacterium LW23]|nr:hypothetical protein DB346_11860 [Verrucomicrobia bacterium LW23]
MAALYPIPADLANNTFPLWPALADGTTSTPLALGSQVHDIPTLTAVGDAALRLAAPRLAPGVAQAPAAPAGPAPSRIMLMIPGGGYMEHGFDHAQFDLARDYAAQGVAAFVMRYRLFSDNYHHPVQLTDGQRAIRTLRALAAAAYPHAPAPQLAIMGFSAGGHLASVLAVHAFEGDPASDDPVERETSRPDAVVCIYPAISLLHRPLRARGMFGDEAAAALPDVTLPQEMGGVGDPADPASIAARCGVPPLEPMPADVAEVALYYSAHLHVTAETPPLLLVHGVDDAIVPIFHSRMMFAALQAAGTPGAAYHEYPHGTHGFGCWSSEPFPPGSREAMDDWLCNVAHWREVV